MEDLRTEQEKEICEKVCCDLICTRHCAIYRKEEERREEKEKDGR